jgi:predicted dehydrogenase
VGFIGCGLIARSHARGLAATDGAVIGSVHDLDSERATRFAADMGATAASSVDEVIAASDAVYVCTWTAAHPELVRAVAAAGRAVFCEKPLAVDADSARAMTRAVTEARVVNQVGLVLRHSPAFRWLAQKVHDPASGPLMGIVFRDDQYLPVQGLYQSTWRADRNRAGAGTLLEHSIHDLDLLRWLLGPITTVTARHRAFHGLEGIEDLATVVLEAASGAQATLMSVWHDVLTRPSQRWVEAFCREAVLTLEGDWNGPVSEETSAGPEPPVMGEELAALAHARDGRGTNPDADFIAAVAEGRPAHPDFALALEAHLLADAAYRSAAAGGVPVEVSP